MLLALVLHDQAEQDREGQHGPGEDRSERGQRPQVAAHLALAEQIDEL